jgi:carbohydrate-selective porin (OprB family)
MKLVSNCAVIATTSLLAAFWAPSARAQDTSTQTDKPPAEQQSAETPEETAQEQNPGSPRYASAGGSERKLPEHAGLFPWSPLSIIEPPVKDFEGWMSKNARLDLGFRLSYGFQQADGGPGERTAASQDYRIHGTFHAFNYEPDQKGEAGNIYFRGEYRAQMFTEKTPFELNGQIGALANTTYGQDQHSPALVQIYYEQFLFDGALRLRGGKLDPDDYFNLGRWADDYRYFDNTIFSAFPASNHPSGGLGVNGQWYIDPEWTFTGGATDVQGRKTEAGFDTVGKGNYFWGADLTYSPNIEGYGQGNYRVGIEYRDPVKDIEKPEETSVYFNVDQEISKDVAPFFRYGHGTGRTTGISDVVSFGLGIDNCFMRPGDAFGVGIGLDKADDSLDSKRDVEYASEAFYRFQLTRAMQYTIGGQLIVQPVNAPTRDTIGILEMRLVIDF